MSKIAVVFSGQGAQKVGMCKDFYDKFATVQNLFDDFAKIKKDLKQVCFNSDNDTLMQTINTQPCLYATEIAIYSVFAQQAKEKDIEISGFAGFSLGEIAALCAGGVYNPQKGFEIVEERARLMQSCAEKTNGAMVACLKLSSDEINKIASKFENTFAVNYNSAAQTVVATKKDNVEAFCTAIKENKGKAVPLAVSGGFHCPFMNEASSGLFEFLNEIEDDILSCEKSVYANKTALLYPEDKKEIINMLSNQVNNPVLWQKTIENMVSDGYDTFIEIGAGKTLCGLIKKINGDVKILNIEDIESLENTLQSL